jgi:hypothetical protein
MEVAPPLERTVTHSDRGGDPASSGEDGRTPRWRRGASVVGARRPRTVVALGGRAGGGPR